MRRSRNFEYITYQNLNITVDEVKRNENQYNDSKGEKKRSIHGKKANSKAFRRELLK